MSADRPRILYVSYDGAGEPLGRSQVIAYLQRLAATCEITLISFEKGSGSRAQTAELLADAGIRWRALAYHKRPPVLSTLWDMVAGARAVRRECGRARPDIIHARSVVPGVIALMSHQREQGSKLLYDARGFWADERVLGGLWTDGGMLHRLAKRCELWCFREADAVVTLAAASVPQIRSWLGPRQTPLSVIPTCADVERFRGGGARADGPRAVWCGSVGTFYRFDLAVRFAAALGYPLTVLTRQVESAKAQLGEYQADVREVAPADVPAELRPGDIGMCFYSEGFANLARAPTRFAEYAAAGAMVAATPGVGDLDVILREDEVGVIIDDESDGGLARAAARIRRLAADPAAQARAREVAAGRYAVADGAAAYLDLYRQLLSGAGRASANGTGVPAGAASR